MTRRELVLPRQADFTRDGTVDFFDFLQFILQFNKTLDDPDFDPRFDLNRSGSVEFLDFVLFVQLFEGS